MHEDVARVLISEDALRDRVAALAGEIEQAYEQSVTGITVVAILTGAVVFLSDLMRHLPYRMEVGYITVSSYTGPAVTSGGAKLGVISLPELRNRDVLIVDDILDSGGTLRVVQSVLRDRGPASLRTAVLLRKPGKAPAEVAVDFVGFDVEDVFVVGYGLDFDGYYRNLPYIAELKSERYGRSSDDA